MINIEDEGRRRHYGVWFFRAGWKVPAGTEKTQALDDDVPVSGWGRHAWYTDVSETVRAGNDT